MRNERLLSGASLPASDATQARITLLDCVTDFATFGGSATSAGAFEIDPHNTIHVDLGLQGPNSWRDMGALGFAARDPIFFAHHANVDKLWSRWNAFPQTLDLPAESYRNPSDSAFRALRWSFYDERQRVVSISAADVLDHQTHLRYVYPAASTPPSKPFLHVYPCELKRRHRSTYLAAGDSVKERVLQSARHGNRIALVIPHARTPNGFAGAFDIVAVRGEHSSPFGTLVLTDTGHVQGPPAATILLEAGNVLEDLLATENPASIRAISRYEGQEFVFQEQEAQLRTQ